MIVRSPRHTAVAWTADRPVGSGQTPNLSNSRSTSPSWPLHRRSSAFSAAMVSLASTSCRSSDWVRAATARSIRGSSRSSLLLAADDLEGEVYPCLPRRPSAPQLVDAQQGVADVAEDWVLDDDVAERDLLKFAHCAGSPAPVTRADGGCRDEPVTDGHASMTLHRATARAEDSRVSPMWRPSVSVTGGRVPSVGLAAGDHSDDAITEGESPMDVTVDVDGALLAGIKSTLDEWDVDLGAVPLADLPQLERPPSLGQWYGKSRTAFWGLHAQASLGGQRVTLGVVLGRDHAVGAWKRVLAISSSSSGDPGMDGQPIPFLIDDEAQLVTAGYVQGTWTATIALVPGATTATLPSAWSQLVKEGYAGPILEAMAFSFEVVYKLSGLLEPAHLIAAYNTAFAEAVRLSEAMMTVDLL